MERNIYRMQDSEGRGPWKPGFSTLWVEDRDDHKNLPPFYEEFGEVGKYIPRGEFCGSGCKTKKQLKRWFTESEYNKLIIFGYRAVSLRITRVVAESDTQLVFTRPWPLTKGVEYFELYRSCQDK